MEVGFDKSSDSDSEYFDSVYDDSDSDYSALNVEFTGNCKKELQDVIIVWSLNKCFMTEQYTEFSRHFNIGAGKISVYMGESIDQQEKIGFMAFKPEPKDQRDWTDDDRNIDPAKSS